MKKLSKDITEFIKDHPEYSVKWELMRFKKIGRSILIIRALHVDGTIVARKRIITP